MACSGSLEGSQCCTEFEELATGADSRVEDDMDMGAGPEAAGRIKAGGWSRRNVMVWSMTGDEAVCRC